MSAAPTAAAALRPFLFVVYPPARRIAADSAKNYQLWNHQRKLAKALGQQATQRELDFCTSEQAVVRWLLLGC
jgi:hypothetical protein